MAKKEENNNKEINHLNSMLAAVMNYLTDETVEEIDFDYLLDSTEGLRQWWNEYEEQHKREIAKEIKQSLEGLSLKELQQIKKQITP
ncbi:MULTISPECIES: hypothetical protein [Cytobacillus]|uniref:Uncharacterized protein n=1 Tax=Cytobacillus stercorigallinarum TaxID=2762240 RepID=A0ABR8QQN9_9BACI|nr:hypothetical protein [Cytobacillus stercorigallinarum]MBD7937856.1 hypothetical protein [Cytobacillus stercorigallinarum]